MTLPAIPSWEHNTGKNFHKAAYILGLIRLLYFEHVPNYLEMAMKILPEGLSTDRLPSGSEVRLNFKTGHVAYHTPQGEMVSFSLADHSQKTLVEALLLAMHDYELQNWLSGGSKGTLLDSVYAHADEIGKKLYIPQHDVSDEQPLTFDLQDAADYADVVYRIFTGVARFKARLVGNMTPVVVWPEHFDLSTLWFATEKPDEYSPHINFGFAPYTENVAGLERPYFYAYAYPLPEGYTPPQLPAPARWESKAYRGMYLAYDDVRYQADLEGYVEDLCSQTFNALKTLLGI